MASAITHFVVGASLSLPALESRSIRRALPRWAIPVTSGLLAVAPDFDIYRYRTFHLQFSNVWGHRGFFHSPFFLLLFCAALAAIVARKHGLQTIGWLTVMWAGCAITHPLLDALTDGGAGVLLLFPFSTERMFFAWRPIHVSPPSILTFFGRAGRILWSELPFCLAALAIGLIGLLQRGTGLRPARPRSFDASHRQEN